MPRRVVITGCGAVSAAGSTLESLWEVLRAGTCLIKPLRDFSAPDIDGMMGAEADLSADDLGPAVDVDARRSRCALLTLAAARRAVAHASLHALTDAVKAKAGVVVGTTLGEERQVGDLSERWAREGADSVDRGFLERADNYRLAAQLAREHGFGGETVLCAAACASGNAALALGYDVVAEGRAPLMLAGAADTLTRSIYCGFHRMGALSKSVCRPFDRRRDGVSFGEGAGFVILEEREHALSRGARMLAEVAGYGVSNDAHHVTAPDPQGLGFARAVRQALSTSAIALEEVDYVCAHGTGTQYNDLGEIRALKEVFGAHAPRVPLSSIKSMIGHTNGAASAIETVACVLALEHQTIPPTANLTEPDPQCDLDCVPVYARPAKLDVCLNLAAGFGGFNVCLALRRPG